jgi:hypothetical protein
MDNRYFEYGCPPLMNDGRFLTNYVRSSIFDQNIRNINNIKSSNEFRHFLQNNGDAIMNNVKGYLRENNTCTVEGRCLPKHKINLNNYVFYDYNLNNNNDYLN